MKYTDYTLVNWPDSQDLMNESWFRKEAILDNREDAESSSYLVPTELLKKHYNNQSNTVISIKDSWTRLEVEVIALRISIETLKWANRRMKDKDSPDFDFSEWMKNNI
jgi:hypothetical protein